MVDISLLMKGFFLILAYIALVDGLGPVRLKLYGPNLSLLIFEKGRSNIFQKQFKPFKIHSILL